MSDDAERELAAFLAGLPDYQRKALNEEGLSLTPDEWRLFTDWLSTSDNFETLYKEHIRLLRHVPARMKEYRKRVIRQHGAGSADALNIPKGNPGRKPNAILAERIWELDAAGKSNREIRETLNAGGENLSLEAVESYLKNRRRLGTK